MRIKNPLLSNIVILLLAGATEFIFNSNALATPGDLYASDLATNSIVVYAHDGTKRTFATGLNSPQGLAFDSSGNLYVADAGSGNVYKFARGGGRTTFASGLINPIGLAIDGPDLLVAENGGNLISSFPLTGGSKTISIPSVTAPLGVAFDGINRYVANTASVFKVAPDGTMTDIDPGDGSRNVTVDTRGNVFVTTDSGGVTKINTDGTIIPFASGLIDPHGLAFRPKRYNQDTDGVGHLLVADTAAGQIYDYTIDGNRTLFGPAGGSPNFLAFETIFPVKADFNGDGKSDILWQNRVNGQRVIWLMNGTSYSSYVDLGIVANIVEDCWVERFQCRRQSGHSLGKHVNWPARHLGHERHQLWQFCRLGNRCPHRGRSLVRTISTRTAIRTFSGKTVNWPARHLAHESAPAIAAMRTWEPCRHHGRS